MTPTPDPPPAAPLTAEQVDAMARRIEAYGIGEMRRDDWRRFFASHAALRDRLSRAEEALRAVVAHAEAGADTGAYEQALFDCRFDAANALGLLAIPTDGAAREGER